MIVNERESRHEHILNVARQMMTAARTAPKGKGIDIIEVAMITDDEIKILSDTMVEMVAEHGMKFFLRDADIECGMHLINRYARTSPGIELRTLRLCHLRISQRRSALCHQQCRCGNCHRLSMCHGSR